jgi:hypothetical protein
VFSSYSNGESSLWLIFVRISQGLSAGCRRG